MIPFFILDGPARPLVPEARLARKRGRPPFEVSLVPGQMTIVKFLEGLFADRLVCADVLEHLVDPGKTLARLCVMTAAGGWQIIACQREIVPMPPTWQGGELAGSWDRESLETTRYRFLARAE